MAVLEEPLKAVTRPLEQMFTLRELDEHVRFGDVWYGVDWVHSCIRITIFFLRVRPKNQINATDHGAPRRLRVPGALHDDEQLQRGAGPRRRPAPRDQRAK